MTIVVWVAVVIVSITAFVLLLSRDWRIELGLLGIQYLSVFWLTSQHWPMSMAAIKLVTGWMAIATLGMTQLNVKETIVRGPQFWPQGWLFRLFAAGIVIVIVIASTPRIDSIIPGIGLPVIAGSLILLGLGLLHLGITTQPFRVIIGLLTVLSGFETIYSALESSILVAAMLSIVNLGLAMVGAYILTARNPENI
ncbi:MAG: hypothetical protein QGM50_05420 [Anaerolineae bacterium]|nr:hypothetical protein [Anaerolineae bacterium]MDK1080513.1 hypothetical protein [Anaerolineae bacterium]MDK1118216.1 hypothetical protein [Anaerolineae bacterium]